MKEQVDANGKVDLLTIFGTWALSRSLIVPYVLVNADTLYNVLVGKPTLNMIGTIVSTPHLAMKFPSSSGKIISIKVNLVDAQECYVKSFKIEPYNLKEEKNKTLSSSVNAITSKDLDP